MPFIIMQQFIPQAIIFSIIMHMAWSISAIFLSPLVQHIVIPWSVFSIVHMHMPMFIMHIGMPFMVIITLGMPPIIMSQHECIIEHIAASSHVHVIIMPPSHFFISILQRFIIGIRFMFMFIMPDIPDGIIIPGIMLIMFGIIMLGIIIPPIGIIDMLGIDPIPGIIPGIGIGIRSVFIVPLVMSFPSLIETGSWLGANASPEIGSGPPAVPRRVHGGSIYGGHRDLSTPEPPGGEKYLCLQEPKSVGLNGRSSGWRGCPQSRTPDGGGTWESEEGILQSETKPSFKRRLSLTTEGPCAITIHQPRAPERHCR